MYWLVMINLAYSLAVGEHEDTNVKFMSLFLTQQLDQCLDLLIETKRVSEVCAAPTSMLPV